MFEVKYNTTVEKAAKDMAGNWQKFDSFVNFDDTIDENWAIIYTGSRDSDLLTESNAVAIEKRLRKFFGKSVHQYSANHSVVGYVSGFAVKVYGTNGKITKAFEACFEIAQELHNYPVLDEDDFSERESEAEYSNLVDAFGYYLRKNFERDVTAEELDEIIYKFCQEANDTYAYNYPTDDEIAEHLEEMGFEDTTEDDDDSDDDDGFGRKLTRAELLSAGQTSFA